jgi:riboflavin synthase alpha subunit
VVTVSVTGDGRWRVATDPLEVTTETWESLGGTVVVVVPPAEVRTWETVGDEAIVVVSGTPYELTMVIVGTGVVGTDGVTETLDGVETNEATSTEVTVTPCSVTNGTLHDGAGV